MSDVKEFRLSAEAVAPLRHALPAVAAQTDEAITEGVPAYATAYAGELGPQIEQAVRAALATVLNLVSRSAGKGRGSPLTCRQAKRAPTGQMLCPVLRSTRRPV